MRKQVSYRTISSLIVLAAVGIAILVNVCAAISTDRYGLRLDLTENKLYELSETTVRVVQTLPAPVTVTVFNTEEGLMPLLREMLSRYQLAGEQVQVRYVDPYQNPSMVDYYKQMGLSIAQDSIVVEGEKRRRLLTPSEFFTVNTDTGALEKMSAEQQLTSALLYAGSVETPLVLFSDGHGERPSAALSGLFAQNNYEVRQVAIAVSGIDEAADFLVIASPVRDFDPQEIAALDAFMARGGRMMVFLEPSSAQYSNLQAFLGEWGIGLRDEAVLEKTLYSDGNPLHIAPIYAPHAINQYFADNRYFPTMPTGRALVQLFQRQGSVSTQPVLYSSGDSYLKSLDALTETAYAEGDETGPFPLALTAEKTLPGDGGTARLFVMGSRGFYADDVMASTSYANADFLVQAIDWCAQTDSSVQIPEKQMTSEPLRVMGQQAAVVGLVLVGVVPLAVLVMGLIVYLRRKHL